MDDESTDRSPIDFGVSPTGIKFELFATAQDAESAQRLSQQLEDYGKIPPPEVDGSGYARRS